jgi:hypothetical protein
MDPVTVIVTALAAGAAAALNETAGQAVRDAYAGLKNLVRDRLKGTPGADVVLERHEADPQTWEPGLKSILSETNSDKDEAIIEAAKRLLEVADPAGSSAGKYNVVVTGGQVGVIGDHGRAYMGRTPATESTPDDKP